MSFAVSLLAPATVQADWSSLSVSVEEVESDWFFENNSRRSRITRLNLNFEEKTSAELRVGANMGRVSARLSNTIGPRETQRFDASYFGVYLRYPLPLGEYFALHSKMTYQYHSGSENSIEDDAEDKIDWREFSLELGLSARLGNFRVTPYAIYSDVSGEIVGESATDAFESDNDISGGVNLDLFLEPTSYVRLRLSTGDSEEVSLIFAREF